MNSLRTEITSNGTGLLAQVPNLIHVKQKKVDHTREEEAWREDTIS
jgi:hypothetical protein